VLALVVAAAAPTGAQSPAASALGPGDWFDGLASGTCFDVVFGDGGAIDWTQPPIVKECLEPHTYEVVDRVTLPGESLPTDPQAASMELCRGPITEFLGRAPETAWIGSGPFWPDAADWAAGVHDALCVVVGNGLVGTARSGSLAAPDQTLVYYRQPADTAELWRARGDGTVVDQVDVDGLALVLGAPMWTPDGQRIVVTVAPGTGDDRDLYLLAVDGAAPELLRGGEGRQEGGSFSPVDDSFVWSAAFGDGELDVYGGTADAPIQLTGRPEREASAQWSPDGSTILFRRVTDGFSQLWTMAPDGSDQVQLTTDEADHYDPRWSPDGSRIAFTADAGGDMEVWVMASDGSDPTPLTDHPANDEFPTWTSDGKLLAFQSSRWGGPTIWLMRADGSDASSLIGESPSGYPMFSPR
jgi:hypothetical protein